MREGRIVLSDIINLLKDRCIAHVLLLPFEGYLSIDGEDNFCHDYAEKMNGASSRCHINSHTTRKHWTYLLLLQVFTSLIGP